MISNSEKRILFVSNCYYGKEHDFSILKEEFPPEKKWFRNFSVQLDLGFHGFGNLYKFKSLQIPNKKPKGKELQKAQKKSNREMASERIKVEHSIGGMKRYRILSDKLRMKNFYLYDEVVEVCSGLWNFLIKP